MTMTKKQAKHHAVSLVATSLEDAVEYGIERLQSYGIKLTEEDMLQVQREVLNVVIPIERQKRFQDVFKSRRES